MRRLLSVAREGKGWGVLPGGGGGGGADGLALMTAGLDMLILAFLFWAFV